MFTFFLGYPCQVEDEGIEQEHGTIPFEQMTTALQPSIKSNHIQLAVVALSILPLYFEQLLNQLLSSASASSTFISPSVAMTNHAAHVLRTTFIALLPTERLSDSKEKIRDLAREALIAAGRAALRLGVHAGARDNSPWDYLSRNMMELAFWSKNPKAREQVCRFIPCRTCCALTDSWYPM